MLFDAVGSREYRGGEKGSEPSSMRKKIVIGTKEEDVLSWAIFLYKACAWACTRPHLRCTLIRETSTHWSNPVLLMAPVALVQWPRQQILSACSTIWIPSFHVPTNLRGPGVLSLRAPTRRLPSEQSAQVLTNHRPLWT